jgi:hypothetical protein
MPSLTVTAVNAVGKTFIYCTVPARPADLADAYECVWQGVTLHLERRSCWQEYSDFAQLQHPQQLFDSCRDHEKPGLHPQKTHMLALRCQ